MSFEDCIVEALARAQAPLVQRLESIEATLKRLERGPLAPQPKATWEPRAVAMKRRKVGYRTLCSLVEKGSIRAKRVPGPGGEHVLLSTADLDQIFPVRVDVETKETRVDIDAA